MNFLITGAAGFIGSNFIDYLIDRTNYKIIGLDRLSYASDIKNISHHMQNNSNRFSFINANMNDEEILKSLDYDIIVNFAADTHVTRSLNDSREFIYNDILATDSLLKSAIRNKKLKLFVHISTSEVYGSSFNKKKMSEAHPLNPRSPYAAAKCGADRLVFSYGTSFDLPFVILRPFNNYGPKQHLEKLIPKFITSIMRNEKITIHGNGKAMRDYIYVKDTCDAIYNMIISKRKKIGEVYNIGSGKKFSINEISTKLFKLSKKNKILTHRIINRPGQVDMHWCNYEKFSRKFKWKPKIQFNDGLIKTYNWYLNNISWWKDKLSDRKVRVVMPNGKIFFH
jgi:dTDP-glucose 4,6-dehydratase